MFIAILSLSIADINPVLHVVQRNDMYLLRTHSLVPRKLIAHTIMQISIGIA